MYVEFVFVTLVFLTNTRGVVVTANSLARFAVALRNCPGVAVSVKVVESVAGVDAILSALIDCAKEAVKEAAIPVNLSPCKLRLMMLDSVASLPVNLLIVAFILTALASVASTPTILPSIILGLNNPPKFALALTVFTALDVVVTAAFIVASAISNNPPDALTLNELEKVPLASMLVSSVRSAVTLDVTKKSGP
jgi:hypothetical protein